MYPPSIQKLIDIFSKFPTVGPKTAARFVFYLLKLSNKEIESLATLLLNLKKTIKICQFCFNPFESFIKDGVAGEKEVTFCKICSDQTRDKSILCLVEKETDLVSIEKTKKYHGFYFILGGTVSTLKKADFEKLRISELQERIKNHPEIKEIIIATNLTTEGEATALYLERVLKPFNKKISRLGRGLPIGAELEYADEETLISSLEGRK